MKNKMNKNRQKEQNNQHKNKQNELNLFYISVSHTRFVLL